MAICYAGHLLKTILAVELADKISCSPDIPCALLMISYTWPMLRHFAEQSIMTHSKGIFYTLPRQLSYPFMPSLGMCYNLPGSKQTSPVQ